MRHLILATALLEAIATITIPFVTRYNLMLAVLVLAGMGGSTGAYIYQFLVEKVP